jgi:hypothetical protein
LGASASDYEGVPVGSGLPGPVGALNDLLTCDMVANRRPAHTVLMGVLWVVSMTSSITPSLSGADRTGRPHASSWPMIEQAVAAGLVKPEHKDESHPARS